MAKKPPAYGPGTVFVCPLKRGGYGVALIARWTADRPLGHRVLFLYGFDRVFNRIPSLEQVLDFTPKDAVHLFSNTDEWHKKGLWPILGQMPGFTLDGWPEPGFIYDKRIGIVHWNQMWRGRTDTPPPMPEGDEQLHYPERDNVWGDGSVDARKYLEPSEFEMFPPSLGLGIGNALEGTLDLAIRDHSPVHYVKVTPQSMKVWERVRQALIRDGLVKVDPPESKAKTKPTKKKKKSSIKRTKK